MCRDTEQLLRFLASHHVVLGKFRCECCGLNLVLSCPVYAVFWLLVFRHCLKSVE